jgi:hypothetical protein
VPGPEGVTLGWGEVGPGTDGEGVAEAEGVPGLAGGRLGEGVGDDPPAEVRVTSSTWNAGWPYHPFMVTVRVVALAEVVKVVSSRW